MKLQIGDFIFDPDARELWRGGRRVQRLEPKASSVLAQLAQAPAETVQRAELLDAVWPDGRGSDEALTQAIAQIRRAFTLPGDQTQYIQTVARAGYRLVAPVASTPKQATDGIATFAPGAVGGMIAARAPIWLALTACALSVAAVALGPHGLRHWLFHHMH